MDTRLHDRGARGSFDADIILFYVNQESKGISTGNAYLLERGIRRKVARAVEAPVVLDE